MSHVNRLKNGLSSILFLTLAIVLVTSSSSWAQPAKGASKFLGNITTRSAVRDGYLTYWNQITGENEHKWGSVEGTRDRMNWGGGDRIANFAKDNNITWKFHTLIWGAQYPSWMNNLSQSDQLAEIAEWMDEAAKQYPDIPMIDVVNEAYEANGGRHAIPQFKDAMGGNGSTGFDWIIKAFVMARERWPKAILIYNDYNTIEYGNEVNWMVKLANAMKAANAPMDAIGVQAHDAYKIPTATVKSNIDKLAATGYPIFVSEYDIGEGDDNRQKQIMEEQYTMFWNHPRILGITYWGYVVGSTWRDNTGLLNSNNSERPALTWLVDFVKKNPNPPNELPNLLNPGAIGVVSDNRGFRPAKLSNSTLNGQGFTQFFDLQGRLTGSMRITTRQASNALPNQFSQKCYIIKKDGIRASTISNLR